MRKKHVVTVAAVIAGGALVAGGIGQAHAAGLPKLKPGCTDAWSNGVLESVTSAGPGTVAVTGWERLCGAANVGLRAYLADGSSRAVGGARPRVEGDPVAYEITGTVTLPAGTRRLCLTIYGDKAEQCEYVTVDSDASGSPTVPVVGVRAGTEGTAIGWPARPPGRPTEPNPECPLCW